MRKSTTVHELNTKSFFPLGDDDKFTLVDLFCGVGGVTQGAEQSGVVATTYAVNHSHEAISTHSANHPETIHLTEDVRNVMLVLSKLPNRVNILHASMECTSYSKAKGGQSRDADSRSLAAYMDDYVRWLNPDMFTYENVEEFMTWGPLIQKTRDGLPQFDKSGRPVMYPDPQTSGVSYKKWVKRIEAMGYIHESRLINSADLGEYTSRTRLFGIFRKPYVKPAWPEQTHFRNPGPGQKKWKGCKEVLDLDKKGPSVFGREENLSIDSRVRRPLVQKTMARIAFGIRKHVLPGLVEGIVHRYHDSNAIDEPVGTISTKDRFAKVSADVGGVNVPFITKNYGNSVGTSAAHLNVSVDQPLHTITTTAQLSVTDVVTALMYSYGRENAISGAECPVNTIPTTSFIRKLDFILKHNKTPSAHRTDEPIRTITTNTKEAHVDCQFLLRQFNNLLSSDIDLPLGTIMTGNKDLLTSAFVAYNRHNRENASHDLSDPIATLTTKGSAHAVVAEVFHGRNRVYSIDDPMNTILTAGEKQLISVQCSALSDLQRYEKRMFFQEFFPESWRVLDVLIQDVRMRYLDPDELARAQGFPENYELGRTKTLAKKHIGNSVPPKVMEKWYQALYLANFPQTELIAS